MHAQRMTFVPGQSSVGYKGHSYGYAPSTNSMHMYVNTQYVLHSDEVPVILYSVSIKAEMNVVH